MKKIILILLVCFNAESMMAQETLQSVTDRGLTTTNTISFTRLSTSTSSAYRFSTIGVGNDWFTGTNPLGTGDSDYNIYNYGTASVNLKILKSNGNVGIGTTNPLEKLSVNGKIRAQEIKVELTGWSDFVFVKDYKLPTLQETEKHIKEKGYLPGIPSAAEVKANGIDLGEMNAKLLQKIEELTLYLIEQNKEIKKLQAEVVAVKSKLN